MIAMLASLVTPSSTDFSRFLASVKVTVCILAFAAGGEGMILSSNGNLYNFLDRLLRCKRIDQVVARFELRHQRNPGASGDQPQTRAALSANVLRLAGGGSLQLLGRPSGHRRYRQCPNAFLLLYDAILLERLPCFFDVGNGLA